MTSATTKTTSNRVAASKTRKKIDAAIGAELGAEGRRGDAVTPSHYQTRRANDGLVIPGREGGEYELLTTELLDAQTGIDVIIAPAGGGGPSSLLLDAIVRVYAETGGSLVPCPEATRSIVDPTAKQRITFVRNRVCRRFRATIQLRTFPAVVAAPPRLYVYYALIGREVHTESDAHQSSIWTPAPGVSGNTGVLRSGAGACLQAYFVNGGAAKTYIMLFKCPVYPAAAPIAGDPDFAVLPCDPGEMCSFNFERGGQEFDNGVSFGCSTNPIAYVVDAAGNVTGFSETR